MTLWLYAILAAPPGGEAGGSGQAGEPLEVLPCVGLWVAAGRLETPPAAAEPALRAHDAVVRRLQEVSRALLPIRFGQTVPDEAALAELLAPRQPALARALEEVAGCRQMTLRVLAPAGEAAAAADADVSAEAPAAASGGGRPPFDVSASSDVSAETSTAAGPERGASDVSAETSSADSPGTRYLAERREAARRRRSLPEIAPLLAELAPLVRAERIERGGPPPLVGSAYHLVPAEHAGEWVARLESAVAALAAPVPRLAWSGPFPPWAFAPELA